MLTPVGTIASNPVEHLGHHLQAVDRGVDGGLDRGEVAFLESLADGVAPARFGREPLVAQRPVWSASGGLPRRGLSR